MVDSERQLCLPGGFSHFMGTVFFLGFLFQSFDFAWLWVCICYILEPPIYGYSSLSQDGRGLWVADTHYEVIPAPLTSKELFCTCVVMEVTLTLRMRNGLCLLLGGAWAQPPPSSCFYRVSAIMDFCPQGRNCSAWCHPSPASVPVWVQRSWETRRDDAVVLARVTQ